MQQENTLTVPQASVTGSQSIVAMAALIREHRKEVPDDLIDARALLLVDAGCRVLDAAEVKRWAEQNGIEKMAGWFGKGLLIPYLNARRDPVTHKNGRAEFSRMRLYPPDGERKYLQPGQSGNHLYLPTTGGKQDIIEMAVEQGCLFLTEGEIDAQWAAPLGVPTIAIAGVDNWKNAKKEKKPAAEGGTEWIKTGSEAIPELDDIPWKNLTVYIVFDSDATQKRQVKAARARLANHIADRYGAQVFTADIPAPRGEKMGLGDWLLKIHRDRGNIDDAIKKLRASARVARGAQIPGRRLGAQALPIKLPGGDVIPDVTQISDSELEGWIAKLESEAQSSDEGSAPAIEALKSEQGARITSSRYGLDLRGKQYSLFDDGLKQSRGKGLESITARPIWPSATGTDLATGQRMAQLRWLDDRLDEREQWVHLNSLSQGKSLLGDGATALGLDALPVSELNARAVAQWLTDSVGWLVGGKRDRNLSSRTGWVETDQGPTYVYPSGDDVYFTGKAATPVGSIDAWAAGIDILNDLQGDRRWQALALIGLCAAAPIVRFVGGGMQNPVIGLVAESSTGKTSLASFALSIYGKASEATYQAMLSTAKGLEAHALTVQDRVFCIDDAQTRDDIKVTENNIYFLANGQTRSRSSRTGGLIGGEVWRGVGMYLAEYSLANSFAGGANLRTIELATAPLDSAKQAQALKRIGEQNSGALSVMLYRAIMNDGPEALGDHINSHSTQLREQFGDSVKRDDLRVIALTCMGLVLLQNLTGRIIDTVGVTQWFSEHVSDLRKNTRNASTQAWEALMTFIGGALWVRPDRPGITGEIWEMGGGIVAWKNAEHIDLNYAHQGVRTLLGSYGGINAHLSAWVSAGYVRPGGCGRLKVQRRTSGGHVRVVRIPLSVVDESSVTSV